MKKSRIILVTALFLGLFGLTGSAYADLMSPQVVIDPTDVTEQNRVVKIEVEKTGDYQSMFIPFDSLVYPKYSDHASLTVSFDVYRPLDLKTEWFFWSWTSDGADPMSRMYGGQSESVGQKLTFPFVGGGTTNTANTVFDSWTNVTLQWDLFETPKPYSDLEYTGNIHGYVSSRYAGSNVDINYPLIVHNANKTLTGYVFGLENFSNEYDVVYLDNFVITGSDIYNSYGFDNFRLGDLNGQGKWETETGRVPEPATMLLLGLGLMGLAGARRKFKK